MTCFDREHYKALKKMCKNQGGVHTYTVEDVSERYNGITVAFAPSITHPNGRMLEVSVSFCSPEDKYKKKHGRYHALRHFCDGATIQLPLNDILQAYGPEYTGSYLTGIFNL